MTPAVLKDGRAVLLDNLELTEAQGLRRAACLLFSDRPEKFISGSWIKIGFFVTNDDLRYQDEIHGSLFDQVEKTLDLLQTKYLKAYISYEGIQRIEKFLFPQEALREAILNAVIHKDYSSGIPIQISVYDDKIVLWNAGQLPEEAKLHPDSHVSVLGAFYSAPHHLRGKTLKIRLSDEHVEIFHETRRVAHHRRTYAKEGIFKTKLEHLPDNAKAYYEATPQNLLAQAKYLNPHLHQLLQKLFDDNAIANIRRAQGFVRTARSEVNAIGPQKAAISIRKAIDSMIEHHQIRVAYFKELLKHYRLQEIKSQNHHIQRKPNNPMLRYTQFN